MISDPLTLAVFSMIIGMLFGAIASALAVMISNDLHKADAEYPSEQDLDAMWEEYTKGRHEK